MSEQPAHALCRLDDLAEGGAQVVDRGEESFIVVRRGDRADIYLNACPHQGTPLENPLGRVLDDSATHLVCSTHGARFRLADGFCVAGICQGLSLRAVPSALRDGWVVRADR